MLNCTDTKRLKHIYIHIILDIHHILYIYIFISVYSLKLLGSYNINNTRILF